MLQRKASLPVTKIRSVKTIRKGARDIPKAFEIFTSDQTYVFKAKDTEHAQKWVECLQIAVARTQSARDQVTDFDLQTWDVARVHKLRASARSGHHTQEREPQQVSDASGDAKRSDVATTTTVTVETTTENRRSSTATAPDRPTNDVTRRDSTQKNSSEAPQPPARISSKQPSVRRSSKREKKDSSSTPQPEISEKKDSSSTASERRSSDVKPPNVKDANSNDVEAEAIVRSSVRASRREKKSQTKL